MNFKTMSKPPYRVLLVFFCLCENSSYAQPGITELQQANASIKSSFFSAFNASLVLATLLGICGAVRIYHNWQMGKDRITPEVASWFFASLFMILSGPFLQQLFGI